MSSQPTLHIRDASIEEVVAISNQIPEFVAPYSAGEYYKRLSGVEHILLIAEWDGMPTGFKAGYAKNDRIFYSWMGGVLPKFRGRGTASALAVAQEARLRPLACTTIELKTRNCHRGMLIFALRSGFHITGFSERDTWEEHRIYLRKNLTR
jgi:ribosomal protein S18 acetylase RimI-like enzyme